MTDVSLGLWVKPEAQPGKEAEVAAFLRTELLAKEPSIEKVDVLASKLCPEGGAIDCASARLIVYCSRLSDEVALDISCPRARLRLNVSAVTSNKMA
jgi:hypothetical protein